MTDGTSLELELAADPALLATARSFVAGVVRAAGFGDGLVEDARIAASEACTAAIRSARGDERVAIRAWLRPASVEISIDGPAGPTVRGQSDAISHVEGLDEGEIAAGLDLVAALFPDTSIEHRPDAATVRFTVATDGSKSPR